VAHTLHDAVHSSTRLCLPSLACAARMTKRRVSAVCTSTRQAEPEGGKQIEFSPSHCVDATMKFLFVTVACVLLSLAAAEVLYSEDFSDGWESRWTKSEFKHDYSTGSWKHSAGKYYGDANNKGIQTAGDDHRFYGISAPTGKSINNKGKTFVLQFSVKNEQVVDCGGGYIKVIPSAGFDAKQFGGKTDYSIMFGPDICGSATRRVHTIFTYKGVNHLIKREIRPETDQLTHVYTLIVKPDNTYSVKIDDKEVQKGTLHEDWDMLKPKTIKDPSAKKPEDWDENEKIDDPAETKPEGWDDIPKEIADPKATKPEDWNTEDDGEWSAPMISNPEYKGEWRAKRIPNPAYKGIWVAPDIPNPDFVDDLELYNVVQDGAHVGFEIQQGKAGSVFDNILIADREEDASAAFAKIKPLMDAEKKAKDDADAEERKKAEDARKAAEEEKKNEKADKEDDEDEKKAEL
jgi:calreticulin